MKTRSSAIGKNTQIISTKLIPDVEYYIVSSQSKIGFYKERQKCATEAKLVNNRSQCCLGKKVTVYLVSSYTR